MSSNRNLEFSRPLTCSLSCHLVVRYVRSFLYLPRWTVLVSEEASGFQRTENYLGSNFVIRCGMWMTPVLIFHVFETKIRSRSLPACVWHQSVWSAFNALGPPMHGLREQLGLKRLVGRHRNHSGVVSLTPWIESSASITEAVSIPKKSLAFITIATWCWFVLLRSL